MFALLIVCVVVVVPALYAADRIIKAQTRARRLRTMSERLDAAAVRAEKQHERRQQVARASAELTSVMPAINRPPLTLPDEPGTDEVAPDEPRTDQVTPDQPGTDEAPRDDRAARSTDRVGRR